MSNKPSTEDRGHCSPTYICQSERGQHLECHSRTVLSYRFTCRCSNTRLWSYKTIRWHRGDFKFALLLWRLMVSHILHYSKTTNWPMGSSGVLRHNVDGDILVTPPTGKPIPAPLFNKRLDASSPNPVKSRRREIGSYDGREISHVSRQRCCRDACEILEGLAKSNPNLVTSRLHEILW